MGESDGARGDGGGYRGRVENPLPPTVVVNGGGGRRRRRPRSPEEEVPPAAVQAVAAAAAAGVEGAVRMAGYLEKRGRRRLVATWRRHWFVLQGRLLLRYRSRRDYLSLASCRGALNLGLASAVRPGPTAAGGAIEVVTRSQVVTLRARDKALRERWLAALLDAARGSSCTANTPPGGGPGLLGANGGPLGAGPHHFRYSLDHLPTALHRHDGTPGAAAVGGGGGAVPGGGMGAANARRSLSLEAVVPCAAAKPKNAHPVYAQPWAHAGGGYGDSVLGVRGRYDDEDAIFFYSSCERNLCRVGGGSRGPKVAAEDEEGQQQPRSASASTAGSSTATASTAASGASSSATKPKRRGLKLRLRRRNTSETDSVCDGICSEPKRRPSFLERVLTTVRGGNGGGSSRSVSPLPPIRASAAPASPCDSASPQPPGHFSDPEYDSVPTTTLTADGEDGRRTPTPQRDAMLAEDEDESSSCASSFDDDDEDTLEDSSAPTAVDSDCVGVGVGVGGRVGAAGLVGSASLLPKPALVELRQRLRRRAESNRDSGDFAYDVTGLNGHAALTSQQQQQHRGSATQNNDEEDGAVFEGYEGFAELRRRWRERASDLAAAHVAPAASASGPVAQPLPMQLEAPPPLPRKQRAAIAAALAAAQEEAAAAAAAAMRASHGGKVREMATHFEAVASSGAARRRSDELGALLAQLAELTAAPLAPAPGAQRPPVPGAASVGDAAMAAVELRARSRKDSDPDYDIPRPHGAALGLASRTPVAATAIDASPFLGGGVHRAFAQLNVATTHGGDDSTDDGELSWTGLSMAPDSLEPLPVRLLDATG